MNRSKWYALAFLIGAFVAGTAVGVAGDRTFEHRYPREGPRRPMDRMSRELNLTDAQRAAFDSILDDRHRQFDSLFKPIRPQMDSIRARSRAQMRALLKTSEQRERFEAIIQPRPNEKRETQK